MPLALDLAIRFLRRRTGRLLRGTALAAFAAVALAVMALVITLALMRGYTDAISAALQRGNAHVVGFAGYRMSAQESNRLAAEIRTVRGIRRATPVTYLSGLINDPSEPANPLPVTVKAVHDPPVYTGLESWPDSQPMPVVLGAGLAERIGAVAGAVTTLRLPPTSGSWVVPSLELRVSGTFSLEFAEFDQEWILVPLGRIYQIMPDIGAAGIEIELDDPLAVAATRAPLEAAFPTLIFTDWREMNRSLFAALRWQTLSLFVVLSLVVAVASFQVSSALVVLAIDKRRASGTLQALGGTPALVRQVLLTSGLLLGCAGLVLGLALGCLASWILNIFDVVRFPEGLARVYMVDRIPFHPAPFDLLAVASVGALLVAAASSWPAWRASREDPVAALRAA
ncbi:MAG: FtsX-like permease family protein [Thermoanaerobaculales bacterium]|jgi:lipoprotein-releasing system permease protein|nr:FtsX-like permease family protein [Thermoanaerobaculales bacterium]